MSILRVGTVVASMILLSNHALAEINRVNVAFQNDVQNEEYPEDRIFICIIGQDSSTGKKPYCYGYVTKDGKMVDITTASDPDDWSFSLADLKQQNYTVSVPQMNGGRINVSYGSKLKLRANADPGQPCGVGIVQPSESDANDPSYFIIYDKIEFTLNGQYSDPPSTAIFVNTTQVDFFGIPMQIQLDGARGKQLSGKLNVDRAGVFQAFAASTTPAAFQKLIVVNPQTKDNVRITAPNKFPTVFTPQSPGTPFPADYFDPHIVAFWKTYLASNQPLKKLTIALSEGGGITSAVGTATGTAPDFKDGQLNFVDNLGNKYVVRRPTSMNVFGCDGAFDLDMSLPTAQKNADGAIKRQIAAAMNRSVESYDPTLWCSNQTPAVFYAKPITNHFSHIFHTLADTSDGGEGGIYGFAYDDVCNKSSTLVDTKPTTLTVHLLKFD